MQNEITIKGTKFKYYKEGEGDPAILIHGWAGYKEEWRTNLPELSKHFSLYYFDLPGQGDAPLWDKGYTVDDYAYFLNEFINQLGLQNVTLFGQSLGTIIVLNYIRDFGLNKIKNIILSSFIVFESNNMKLTVSKILHALHKRKSLHLVISKLNNSKLWGNHWGSIIGFKGNPAYQDIYNTTVVGLKKVRSEAYIDGLCSMMQLNSKDYFDSINKLSGKILLVYGKEDKLTEYHKLSKYEISVPILIVENAAHCPIKEQEVEFMSFLEKNKFI